MHEYDNCGKYRSSTTASILRMACVWAIVSWMPVQTGLVQHRWFPDGLIEVLHEGEDRPDTYLLEIACRRPDGARWRRVIAAPALLACRRPAGSCPVR